MAILILGKAVIPINGNLISNHSIAAKDFNAEERKFSTHHPFLKRTILKSK